MNAVIMATVAILAGLATFFLITYFNLDLARLKTSFQELSIYKLLLKRKLKKLKKRKCERQIPELIDVVLLAVSSGVSFDGALELYCSRFSNELSQELSLPVSLMRSGISSKETALKELERHLDIPIFKRFVETTLRALKFGAPLNKLLESLSIEARKISRASVEEEIAKAPTKMLIVTGLLILPAMLILIMSPFILKLVGNMS